jgi:hypothetical protein
MGIPFTLRTTTDPLSILAGAPSVLADQDWLRGRTIVHKIVIGLTDPNACVIAILQELQRTSAEIRSLTVKPVQAGAFELVLQATCLDADDARRLVGWVAAHRGVNSAAIEHVLIR